MGLYRTYEELKPVLLWLSTRFRLGLYRTYEELKHGREKTADNTKRSLYRTYEELKLIFFTTIQYTI